MAKAGPFRTGTIEAGFRATDMDLPPSRARRRMAGRERALRRADDKSRAAPTTAANAAKDGHSRTGGRPERGYHAAEDQGTRQAHADRVGARLGRASRKEQADDADAVAPRRTASPAASCRQVRRPPAPSAPRWECRSSRFGEFLAERCPVIHGASSLGVAQLDLPASNPRLLASMSSSAGNALVTPARGAVRRRLAHVDASPRHGTGRAASSKFRSACRS